MIITINPELEAALSKEARRQGVSSELMALKVLSDRFLAAVPLQPQDEWERRLLGVASDCGVSLSNQAVSSEGLYE